MNIAVERYYHPIYWPYAYELFRDFSKEVNGSSRESLLTEYSEAGDPLVLTDLERWAITHSGAIKVVRDLDTNNLVGFICAEPHREENNALFIDSLYITPSLRYNGLTRALLASYPGYERAFFTLHSHRSEGSGNPMLQGLLGARKTGFSLENPDLETWTVDLDTRRAFASNDNMIPLRQAVGEK